MLRWATKVSRREQKLHMINTAIRGRRGGKDRLGRGRRISSKNRYKVINICGLNPSLPRPRQHGLDSFPCGGKVQKISLGEGAAWLHLVLLDETLSSSEHYCVLGSCDTSFQWPCYNLVAITYYPVAVLDFKGEIWYSQANQLFIFNNVVTF